MKKNALLLFTLFTITVYGQTEKGNFLIGGTTNFGSSYLTEGDDGFTTTSSDFTLSSNLGYSIANNLFVGLNIQFLSNDYKINFLNAENNTKELVFSPFLKYYFLKEKLKPFALIRYGFGNSKSEIIDSNSVFETKSDLTKLNIGGGISYFFTEYFSLDIEVFYQRNTFSTSIQDDNLIYRGFATNLGFSIFL
jgi:hypothetical protein